MKYDFTKTTIHGEVYSCKMRFDNTFCLIGWDVYKNDNWIDLIREECKTNGYTNRVSNDQEAVNIAIIRERENSEAEISFYKNHPECNP